MICETLTNRDISITLWQLSDGPLFFEGGGSWEIFWSMNFFRTFRFCQEPIGDGLLVLQVTCEIIFESNACFIAQHSTRKITFEYTYRGVIFVRKINGTRSP